MIDSKERGAELDAVRHHSPNSPTPACLHRRYWHE